ncbi:hypothetical protein [Blastococcus haudaquaticus]|uniref:Uncharacterized protein n=1 Tax=Blastococcus haudaquaticus TaxID=1938745 RepID=A0A286H3G0_9ACTN|nr:hypothetical protein [Blastococcus haudaquaticus]SOE02333.1 hypothetical protein SAMN06272739_3514 [Blastococcus haudaquaticus]
MTTDDENRWSEAQSLLDRKPTEPAERRLRRSRRRRLLTALGASLFLGAPIGILAYRFADDAASSSPVDVPTGQVVAGVVLALAGLVLAGVGFVAQLRANRRMSAWNSPLYVLTKEQRKELLAVVRGRVTVGSDRLPLARHLASNTLQQRATLPLMLGVTAFWLGQAVALSSWWYATMAGVFVLLIGGSVPFVLRQERQARRFLEQYPAPDVLAA